MKKFAWGAMIFFVSLTFLAAIGQLVIFLITNPYPGSN